jgi:hypothetical protein
VSNVVNEQKKLSLPFHDPLITSWPTYNLKLHANCDMDYLLTDSYTHLHNSNHFEKVLTSWHSNGLDLFSPQNDQHFILMAVLAMR